MSPQDFIIIWHDVIFGITMFALSIFILSGTQDLIYDIGAYIWSLYKYLKFANRDRLTIQALRLREQQQIAVMVPAWKEADVIGKMVENIIKRVEYRNYTIFVGTYPNDLETQRAVDEVAAIYPQIVKVVTTRPGPTNKADNLNQVYQAIRNCERSLDMTFDIFAMHDAEDLVHPFSFLLYNYLIPRAEIIQLPILPLPVEHWKWTHWVYADEFTENHLKDVVVREKIGGFVPFAGVGTGFSRRALSILQEETGEKLFNEGSLTEDYSMSLSVYLNGIKTIFVRLILDDGTPWYVPLCKRPAFISNWAYFPMDFVRSVRQKTRWIIGISLQEWENLGWQGNWHIRENLMKDRKIFLSSIANMCGYISLIYFFLAKNWLHSWQPLMDNQPWLANLLFFATILMCIRLAQRFILVTIVYGPVAGLLSAPRMLYANFIAILAAYRALITYYQQKRSNKTVRWDKTDHAEGVGEMPQSNMPTGKKFAAHENATLDVCLDRLRSTDMATVIAGMELLPRNMDDNGKHQIMEELIKLSKSSEFHVRAIVARVCGFLQWDGTTEIIHSLLYDNEWIVRSNSARALLKFAALNENLIRVFSKPDRFAWDIMVRELEQNDHARRCILADIDTEEMSPVRDALAKNSRLFAFESGRDTTDDSGDKTCDMRQQFRPKVSTT
jgi:adsorption protein B